MFDSTDVDAVRELLQYGLKETDCDIISCEGDEMARFISEKVTIVTKYMFYLLLKGLVGIIITFSLFAWLSTTVKSR